MTGFFGVGLSGREIYEQVTGGPGTGSLETALAALKQEAKLEEQRAEEIRQLADEIGAGWQGAAADGAVGVAGPMADTARDRLAVMIKAVGLLNEQSHMFNHTKNSVVPVPAEPPKSNFLNDLAPWETDLDKQISQYQNDVQHNFDVYGRYDDSSLSNEERLPRDFPSNTEWSGNVSVAEPGSSPGGGPNPGGGPGPGGGGPNPGGSGPNSGGGPDTASGPSSVSGPPQGTDPSEVTPPPNSAPPGTRVPIGGPLPAGNQPLPGGLPPLGGLPVGTVPPGGRGLGLSPEGGGRGGSGAGGPGVRGEGGPGGRGGPGARGGAVGEHGPGGRPGAGAGGLASEEAAARRGAAGAAGGRGAGAAGGFGPMGAGRGRGDEDYEHDRKYLIGPDPEATFGADEMTAPPVIGEED